MIDKIFSFETLPQLLLPKVEVLEPPLLLLASII